MGNYTPGRRPLGRINTLCSKLKSSFKQKFTQNMPVKNVLVFFGKAVKIGTAFGGGDPKPR